MEKKQPYHHGALRSALLDEALRSLERDGLESLSLRGLAHSVGVSKTAPYRHFADKRALLVDMAAEGFRMFADALEAARLPDGPPGGAASGSAASGSETSGSAASAPVRLLFSAYVRFARSRPALYRLMFSRLGYSLHSEACRRNAERAFACLDGAVTRAQAAGWHAAEDRRSLALSVWAQAHGWAGLITDGLLTPDLGPSTGVAGNAGDAGAPIDALLG